MADGFFPIGGGNSSVEVSRNAKGEYTWAIKVYFLGNTMQQIRRSLENVLKARVILEHVLGQEIVPTDEMAATLKTLEEAVKKGARKQVATVDEKTNKGGKDAPIESIQGGRDGDLSGSEEDDPHSKL